VGILHLPSPLSDVATSLMCILDQNTPHCPHPQVYGTKESMFGVAEVAWHSAAER